jgi:hypothetical protein
MGFLDIFKGSNPMEKHGARVANRRAQAPDRWESIQYLSKQKSAEAAAALLERFTFRVDPSITDQEERDAAFAGILDCGPAAVEPLRAFLRKSDSIAWPLKALERLLSADEVTEELLGLLSSMQTEYERDPDKKIQVIASLEQRKHGRIRSAVERFLGDANETVRFHAVATIYAQGAPGEALDDALVARVLDVFGREDSVRTRARILDGFTASGTPVPSEARESVFARLPDTHAMDAKSGLLKRRSA